MKTVITKCRDCVLFKNGYCEHYKESGYKQEQPSCDKFALTKLEYRRQAAVTKKCGYCVYFDSGFCLPKQKVVDEKKKACNYWISCSDGKVVTNSDIILLGQRMKSEQNYMIKRSYDMKRKG